MYIRLVLVSIFVSCSGNLLAAEPTTGPLVEGYGPTFPMQEGDVPLPDGFEYKVVFEVTEYTGDTTTVNNELLVVSRFLNMHARHGVPEENLDVAVVVHGETLKSMLVDEAYSKRYGSDNPSADLVMKLEEAGVRFFICGQSMGFRKFDREELLSPAKVGLSAMTMLVYLQSEGYSFLP
jgi:intracellular sulfur oxidation DsrE/DsrF family protein